MTEKRRKVLSRISIFLLIASVISFLVFYLSVMLSQQGYHYVDPETLEFVQLKEIPEGSQTAVIETSLGEIRAVLYPEYAPNTVSQFITLAEQGWYDDTYVFDIQDNVYFSAGSGDAQGSVKTPPVFENQERVPQELHQNLWTFRGALCAVNTSTDTDFFKRLFKSEIQYTGSCFRFLNTIPDFQDEEFLTQFREASGSEELAENFISLGGVPNFAQQMTVFGQAYAGLNIIEKICSATSSTEEIRILSVKISSYSEEDKALNELKISEKSS